MHFATVRRPSENPDRGMHIDLDLDLDLVLVSTDLRIKGKLGGAPAYTNKTACSVVVIGWKLSGV